MPSDLAFRAMNVVHHAILRVTGQRAGWRVFGMRALTLTTVGRRSGERRTVMLTTPLSDGDALVIVASRGGHDRHPAWYHNLLDHPEVEVAVQGGPPETRRARVATDDERQRLWPRVVDAYKGYGDYQRRTDRQIPLVLLDPVS
jgi:deazaflavin-dependent oxidoreductase (nitroreductase family)